jgi:hypothetical protein
MMLCVARCRKRAWLEHSHYLRLPQLLMLQRKPIGVTVRSESYATCKKALVQTTVATDLQLGEQGNSSHSPER